MTGSPAKVIAGAGGRINLPEPECCQSWQPLHLV